MNETEAREVARGRLAALNVDGWRAESDHGCDGTEEMCAVTCPIQVQVRVSPDEIIDAIAGPIVAAREVVWRAPIEALAAEWEAIRGGATESVCRSHAARLRAALGSVPAPGNEAGL